MKLLPLMLCAPLLGEATDSAKPSLETLPSLLWMAPMLSGGGYSSEAMSYTMALSSFYHGLSKSDGQIAPRIGFRQFAEQGKPQFVNGLPDSTLPALKEMFKAGSRDRDVQGRPWDVVVCHSTPDFWLADGAFKWGRLHPCPPPGAKYRVGRSMYETDRLPAEWVPRLNAMDEVWVPSAFAVGQFASSGVSPSKIVVVPEAVDTDLYDPARHEPLVFNSTQNGDYVFLSVFKWELRKGWDILLRAYFEEFSAHDPVVLYLKTTPFHSDGNFSTKIRSFAQSVKQARWPLARYEVLPQDLPLSQFPSLYRMANAFVLPSRGEGWGRPHVEAMAMGLPVIATNWSGPTEFMSEECSLPLRSEGLAPVEGGLPKGHLWAIPSVSHLRELMRWATEHREEAARLGVKARESMVANYSPETVLRRHVVPQLERIAEGLHRNTRLPNIRGLQRHRK